MSADYFPLVEGSVREYKAEDASGSGTFKVEVLDVQAKDGKTRARCRRTIRWNGGPEKTEDFEVVRDAKSVRSDTGVEFKLPVAVGVKWTESPNEYRIDALDAEVDTPAGKFKNCLRVTYLIAGGDGGSGERDYAPGVGLVKVVDQDEGEPFRHELTAYAG